MLRLFSIFPTGGPGFALLLLRVSLAAAVLNGDWDCLKAPVAPPMCLARALLSLLLSIGFLTPIASIAAGLLELADLWFVGSADWRFLVLSALNALAVSLLGPGAYSLDARLFARRVIVFPPDPKSGRR